MDPTLQRLIRYQELSLELTRLNARLAQYPVQVKAIDDAIEAAAGGLATARASLSDHQKDRRKLEMELQDLEVRLKKYNDQLMQVKTNDEYKAMQHEIAGVKEKIGAVEEKILLLMEEADSGDRRVKGEERALQGRRQEADVQKAAVRQEEAQVRAEADRVQVELTTSRVAIPAAELERFNRIAQGRNGVAMARARDERCQECNVRLRPHLFQEIKRNDRIIECDSCKRILYYLPEAPVSDTATA